jgi:hypothetical protein
MHLPIDLSFNTMGDFIKEIGKSVHNWGSIVDSLNIFEIFVASDFSPHSYPGQCMGAWPNGIVGPVFWPGVNWERQKNVQNFHIYWEEH